jgi:hypothetical protein
MSLKIRQTCKCGRVGYAKVCSPCRRRSVDATHRNVVRGLNMANRALREKIKELEALITSGRAM